MAYTKLAARLMEQVGKRPPRRPLKVYISVTVAQAIAGALHEGSLGPEASPREMRRHPAVRSAILRERRLPSDTDLIMIHDTAVNIVMPHRGA